ncbi:MAG: ABC transporter permease [Trueperaceae bacterium]|nr:MAG: ABC transporter permease [Trueperaceae bacterium]
MTSYIARRFLITIPTILGVITLAFLMIRLAPGDPAELMMGDYVGISAEVLEDLRRKLGVDRPVHEQYVLYLTSVLTGDFGKSFRNNQPVLEEIASQLPFTFQLAVAGVVFAILLGVPAGVISALWRNSWIDYIATSVAMIWVSSPSFWFAILLIYVFAFMLGWFPIFGAGTPGDWRSLGIHLVLPAIAVGARSAALITRITRSAMLDVLNQDYVRTARAKGVSEGGVVNKHAFRNAAIPIMTVVGLDIAYLLSGTVIIETVFSRPGLGKLVIDAIFARDFPSVQGGIVVFALIVLMVNLLVDVSYAVIDPRIRYT